MPSFSFATDSAGQTVFDDRSASLPSWLDDGVSPELAEWIIEAPIPKLGDSPRAQERSETLARILERDWSDIGRGDLARPADSAIPGIKSALWLLAGELDRSHDISQNLKSPSGSFLHGIMHRREGDFGNAKYWFRTAGDHPVEKELRDAFPQEYKNACQFVDQCESSQRESSSKPNLGVEHLEVVQWREWIGLFRLLLRERN
ncbi:MAG: hypothetical protein AAF989_06875 [Planctomycetota bacterium]